MKETTYMTPEYLVTIGNALFCVIKNRTKTEIEYDLPVIEVPIIKELGLSREVNELEINASGGKYASISKTVGADINLKAVVLPPELVQKLQGETEENGLVISKTTDIALEFAFGYWGENSDGSYVCYWHPLCKLVPADESYKTSGKGIPEPEVNYKIKVLPFNDTWRILHRTNNEKVQFTREQFFEQPLYNSANAPVPVTVDKVENMEG